MNKPGPRGRRSGAPDTRRGILEVARRRFLAEGYVKVTMRSLAADAGVNAALISYFFGSKRGLFAAAMALSANPADLLAEALPGPPARLAARVLTALVSTWDDPQRGGTIRVLLTAAAHDEDLARLIREMIDRELVTVLAEHLGGTGARARAGLFAAQALGVIHARYVLRLEPTASMPADELVRGLAPGFTATLFGAPPRAQRRPSG
ncbi:TetR/AcrR family transcriptional regulator [Rhodococcus maanshanensis]|uniref:DNA-binding transcriptional regulator, AcrR family n=1 Tax=Rhodococcus maanshanensis TaxID=183556 RepID=A0A1H7V3J7_9NOCA|nr:TetR family transcriptional regulator [Rhodococcus maanshanensis]SEM03639.1 DNA-binding transcriptional regulator, AcrR family [Rhodococcus maanshanensis]